MSDEKTGLEPETASSAGQSVIPKERLDEVIAQNREMQRQLHFTQQQLAHMVNSQRQVQPPQVDPAMERLKQEHPELYEREMRRERELKQVRAGLFSTFDRQDKQEFLAEFGDKAKKRLGQVEEILQRERDRGNGTITRSAIFTHLMGVERLKGEDTQAAAPIQTRQEAPGSTNAPPSDPNVVATIKPGTAAQDLSKLSFEERTKALENVAF